MVKIFIPLPKEVGHYSKLFRDSPPISIQLLNRVAHLSKNEIKK